MLDRPNMPDMQAVFTLMGWALRGGGKQRECGCPLCGSTHAGTVNTVENLFHCFKCQAKAGDALDLYRQATGAAFAQAATDLGCWIDDQEKAKTVITPSPVKAPARPVERAEVPENARAYIEQLRADSRPYPGTVVASHLKARGCVLPPEGAVRYLPNLKHRSGYAGPAMFSLVTDILTGAIVGGHRTWVAEDGTKPVIPARMTLGQKKGAVVRLWPDEDVTHGLGIAEGIETTLSLAQAFRPVWACIDAGNMAAFPLLPGIEALTIAADNDEAGIRAANQCAARWHAAGREVRIVMAPDAGQDLNDLMWGAA